MQSALFVGDVSWDTSIVVDHVPEPDEKALTRNVVEDVGGVVTNAAVACSLAGGSTILVCGIAADLAGTSAFDALKARGLTVLAHSSPPPTARAIIILDAYGEKRLVLFPGGCMYPNKALVESVNLERVGWVHTALYDLEVARMLVEKCRQSEVSWSIDLEPATIPVDLRELADVLRGCHTVFLNARAAKQIGSEAVQTLLTAGVKEVIETLGSEGVRWNDTGSSVLVPPALKYPVIDTTGAGDALAGWYIASRLLGHSTLQALDEAVAVASYSVSRLGGVASYPSSSDPRFSPGGS